MQFASPWEERGKEDIARNNRQRGNEKDYEIKTEFVLPTYNRGRSVNIIEDTFYWDKSFLDRHPTATNTWDHMRPNIGGISLENLLGEKLRFLRMVILNFGTLRL